MLSIFSHFYLPYVYIYMFFNGISPSFTYLKARCLIEKWYFVLFLIITVISDYV